MLSPVPSAPATEVRVIILDFKFEPSSLTVAPGTTVTWTNRDDEPHSATSAEKPKLFDSGALDTAESYSFTFRERGSFPYFCKLHPHMTGVIVVP
ncbi:MAG TPA: cupredoxin family copper-binding protein [Planctomycetota bacterium]|nr:cupredoxin family copper-binding protein [Planctomycetota bacterium]